ncbi:MAG: RIP metalloprotease RseP [Pseudomonadota bacterium]
MSTVLWFLLALGILVTFHEYGHFYVARRCGVKVLRFSVGFGKPLYTWCDRYGTEFVIAAIPLGGYVKMLDEREGEVAAEELPQAFTQKTVWQRMAIVTAGPVANFILAVVLYFALALLGTQGVAPVIGSVQPNSAADRAQLQPGEEIISIDGKQTPLWSHVFEALSRRIGDTGTIAVELRPFAGDQAGLALSSTRSTKLISIDQWLGDNDRPDLLAELGIEAVQPETDWVVSQVSPGGAADRAGFKIGDRMLSYDQQGLTQWAAWVQHVRDNAGKTLEVLVDRDGQLLELVLVPEAVEEQGVAVGKIGLGTNVSWPDTMRRQVDYSLGESIVYGFGKTGDQALVILSFLKKLITLDVSVKNMGGTFTIAEVAGSTAAAGLTYYLSFLAFFSVSLGVFNLLPIPVLDGGHLLFYLIEAIKGKPLPEKVQLVGYQIGLLLVVSVMVIAHYNDLVRLFS